MLRALVTLIAAITLAGTATAEEYRLIVKPTEGKESNEWHHIKIEADSVEQAIQKALATELYEEVELDIEFKQLLPSQPKIHREVSLKRSGNLQSSAMSFSDPYYVNQWYWLKPTAEHLGQMNIEAAVKSAAPNNRPRIGIVDSGFYEHSDLVYEEDSYSFTTMIIPTKGIYEVRGPNYLDTTDQYDCDFAHGTSVSALAAGLRNNGIGIAGVAEADIIAARALHCGAGYLSDVVDAIYYLAGKEDVTDAPVISSPVDVINLSLSARPDSDEPVQTFDCPKPMQDAIDYAVQRGISIAVAGGNYSKDAYNVVPANCNHVITVGAADRNGQKSAFSNYGEAIDILAPGSEIAAPGPDNNYYFWDGTSQATPLVSGTIALAKSEYPEITPSEIEWLLKQSANPRFGLPDAAENDCDTLDCGSGIVDSESFMSMTRAYMSRELSHIKHALNTGEDCKDELYIDAFGDKLNLCAMYKVAFMEGAEANDNVTYQLYETTKGQILDTATAALLLETTQPTIHTANIDPVNYDYGFLKCTNGTCEIALTALNQDNAEIPDLCI